MSCLLLNLTTRKQVDKVIGSLFEAYPTPEVLELSTRKNTDYADIFADYGLVDIIVRIGDKIRQLSHIGINMVNNESVRDTLIDLHNCTATAVMLIDNEPNSA